MRRRHQRRRARPGTSPGTLTIDPGAPKPRIRVTAYRPEKVVEHEVDGVGALRELLGRWPVVWVNVDGLGDEATLRELGELFGMHRLALEDVVNVVQRPKVEPYDEHLFIISRMALAEQHHPTEQVSLVLGENYVLTFQERPGDCFEAVRERIRQGQGKLRRAGPDYLAYALLDAVVDSYFPALEQLHEQLERLEERIFAEPDEQTAAEVQRIKGDLRHLRRAAWPHRDAIGLMLREESRFITPATRVYLRDVVDHAQHVNDLLTTYYELGLDLMNAYLSSVSNRMNEVMKVLTVMAAIFIPLSFLAGIYGMNFDPTASPWNMPELATRYGYPVLLLVMALIGIGLLLYFRRRGWVGRSRTRRRWNKH